MYTSIVTFFQEGGSFMVPIAIVLAIGTAIAIERYVYLTQSRARNRMLLKKIMPLMEKGDFKLAYSTSNKSKQPIAKILNSGLSKYKTAQDRNDVEAAMEESMLEIIPRLEKRTHYLAMYANIATLLGLLGTIIGLIKAFTAVAQVDPALKGEILSTSISVAMNTTAFGLMVAIPLLLVYTVIQTKTTEIVDSLEMATVKFVNLIMQRKNKSSEVK